MPAVARRDRPHTSRVLELQWGDAVAPARGPKPALSREQVLKAAIAIADRGGLGALSMRSVAEKLGFTTMALYRHVPGRAELLELMRDLAIGEPPVPEAASTWRERMSAWARANVELHHRHPWLLEMEIKGPPLGPNHLRWLEAGLAILAPLGLPERELVALVTAIDSYVRGAAQFVVGVARDPRRSRGGNADADRARARVFEAVVASPRYPVLGHLIASGALAGGTPEEVFEQGLGLVLDGVALRIPDTEQR